MSMMDQKIVSILIRIVFLLILAYYFLINRYNAFSESISRDKYDPEKVSRLIGLGSLGFAISCIPSLIGVIYQKTWPVFITIAIMVFVIIAAYIYEHKGKLK